MTILYALYHILKCGEIDIYQIAAHFLDQLLASELSSSLLCG